MTDAHQNRPRHDVPQSQAGGSKARDALGRVSGAYDSSVASARDAAQRAAEGIETNPLGVVAGGLAIGVIAGALIPRSAKEKELMAPLGRKLGEAATRAVQAAREAGAQELEQRGLTKDAAKDRGRELFQGVGQALSTAGQAAVSAAKAKPEEGQAGQTDQAGQTGQAGQSGQAGQTGLTGQTGQAGQAGRTGQTNQTAQ